MLRFASFACALLIGSAALASELPRYDVDATCRAAPSLEDGDRNCERDETQARTQLERQWAGFDAKQRALCVQEESLGGSPSYVDLLTCLQL